MTTPFYVAPEQLMKDRADYARKGIARGRALVAIQAFLSGATADLEDGPSRIGWIADSGQPKVPVMIAATGPHVIGVGARHADGGEMLGQPSSPPRRSANCSLESARSST